MADSEKILTSIAERTPQAVLDFWLGPLREIEDTTEDNWRERMTLWRVGVFARGGEHEWFRDAQQAWCDQIHEEGVDNFFKPAEVWDTPHGWLAKIIVLDQFGRSVYRGTPVAYANDEITGPLIRHVLAQGWDTEVYNEVERMWIYVALSHPEANDLQEMSVDKWTQWSRDLIAASPPETRKVNQHVSWYFIKSIIEHSEAVLIYDRFPHRNPIMNRPHGAGEIQYLRSAMRPLWSFTQPPQPLYYSLHALLHSLGPAHDCRDIKDASVKALNNALGLDADGENSINDFIDTNQGAKRSITELYRHMLLEKKQDVVKSVTEHPSLVQFSRQVKKAIFRDPDALWPPKSAKANVPPVIDVIELNAAVNCPHFASGEIAISRGAINAFIEKSGYHPLPIAGLHEGVRTEVIGSNIVCLDASKEGFTKALIVERGTFKSILGPMFTDTGHRDQVLAHLYELLDMDYSGAIDASELLVALILFGEGNLHDKLALAFDVFDIDGSDSLDLDEIENLVQTCFLRGLHFTEALFRAYTDPSTDTSEEAVTLYTLNRLDEINNASHNALLEQDADGDGSVCKEEFIAWASGHELLKQFFSLQDQLFGGSKG